MRSPLRSLGLFLGSALIAFAQTDEDRQRYHELRAEIARHDELYFREGAPEISDAAYDRLRQDLEALVRDHPELGKASEPVGLGTGDDRTGLFPTRRHAVPMLSLRKARREEDVRVFDQRLRERLGAETVAYAVEPKYDGVALSVVYENGRLVAAVTRGNGLEGDEVTENVRALLNLPEVLPGPDVPARVEVRGEAYVTFAQFEATNREREATGETPFAHPRALAAGTLKLLDEAERTRRSLSFVAHGWGEWTPARAAPRSGSEFRSRTVAWGLPVAETLGEATGAEGLWAILQRCDAARRSWPFPHDGVVVKIDQTEAREHLGDGVNAPEWALAFKYPAETVVTRVVDVTWQVGRTGAITPVAELEPVRVGGVTVSRATLHSPAHAARLDVRKGDSVEVERAGEVIPQILAVRNDAGVERASSLEIPTACPSCGTALEADRRAGHLRCPHYPCPAQIERRLEHYVSASAVDIRGFGPALLHALVQQGSVRSPADLYRLSHDDLLRAGAGGAATALLAAVAESRSAELWRIVFGLGIPRIGATTSRVVAGAAGNLSGVMALARAAPSDREPSLTESVQRELARAFENPEVVALVQGLHEAGLGRERPTSAEGRSEVLQGHVVVFTGALAGMTRAQAASEVQAAGGRVASTITSRTTLVVAGEGAGAKLETARRRGLRVVGEAEFRQLLAGGDAQSSQR